MFELRSVVWPGRTESQIGSAGSGRTNSSVKTSRPQTAAGKPDGTWGSTLDFRRADGAGHVRCGNSPPSPSIGCFEVRAGNPYL
jgi:hypothetical protein